MPFGSIGSFTDSPQTTLPEESLIQDCSAEAKGMKNKLLL